MLNYPVVFPLHTICFVALRLEVRLVQIRSIDTHEAGFLLGYTLRICQDNVQLSIILQSCLLLIERLLCF